MIRSKIELNYDARDGEKKGFIELEITDYSTDKLGATYKVIDYLVFEDGSKMTIKTKEYRMSNEQIDNADVLVRDLASFSGMPKTEREWLKIKLMLLHLTKDSPIYFSTSEDWELCE